MLHRRPIRSIHQRIPKIQYLILLSINFLIIFSPLAAYAEDVSPAAVVPQPALGDPLPNLTEEQLLRFKRGKKAFEKSFSASEGLGPIFNGELSLPGEMSCVLCHNFGGIGGGGTNRGSFRGDVTRFGEEIKGVFNPLEHKGGSLLQNSSLSDNCRENIPTQANVTTKRTSTQMFGAGLIEAIADSDLLVNQINGGVAHRMKALENPLGPDRVGRFGWKAQQPTLLSFAADAANNEMGISNELLPIDNQPNLAPGDGPCADMLPGVDDVADINDVGFIHELRDFMRFLAPPPQTPKSGMRGEQIFNSLGCAVCHIPSFVTAANLDVPALSQKQVKAYSDFLLHDMGGPNDLTDPGRRPWEPPRGGDGIVQGAARQTRMRTAPLWGGGEARDTRFHNGDITDSYYALDKVIAFHAISPEIPNIQNDYDDLTAAQKEDLLRFIRSLGHREFKHDPIHGFGDKQINAQDFQFFRACFDASVHGQIYDPDHACAVNDVDQDSDVDMRDAATLLTVYQGPIYDCQCDGSADLIQILNGTSVDANGDAGVDECMTRLALSVRNINNSNSPEIEVITGMINLRAILSGLQFPQAEIFYTFAGQGNTWGPSFNDVICMNLAGPALSVSFNGELGFNEFFDDLSIPVPLGKNEIYLQAKVNGAKSNVIKLDLFCRDDVDCDTVNDDIDNCPYVINPNQESPAEDETCADLHFFLALNIAGPGNIFSINFENENVYCEPSPSPTTRCQFSLPHGSQINLSASPTSGDAELTGWSGACTGTNSTCSFTLNQNLSVTANFRSTVLAAPKNLVATVVSPSQINLNWNNNNDSNNQTLMSCEIERSEDGANFANVGTVYNCYSNPNYSDSTIKPAKTYRYQVRGWHDGNPGGYSPYSNIASATTPAAPIAGGKKKGQRK